MKLGELRMREEFKRSLHQGRSNLHVLNHNHPNQSYIPMCTKWLEWIIEEREC